MFGIDNVRGLCLKPHSTEVSDRRPQKTKIRVEIIAFEAPHDRWAFFLRFTQFIDLQLGSALGL